MYYLLRLHPAHARESPKEQHFKLSKSLVRSSVVLETISFTKEMNVAGRPLQKSCKFVKRENEPVAAFFSAELATSSVWRLTTFILCTAYIKDLYYDLSTLTCLV